MFLDKFDLELVKVDDTPLKPEEKYQFTFWSSGKIDRWKNGIAEPVSKDEVKKTLAMLGVFYSVKPEEYAAALVEECESRVREKR